MPNTAGFSNYQSFATLTHGVVKAAPGAVVSLRVLNKNAAIRYFQLFDRATDVAGGETPLLSWAMPAGSATAPFVLALDSAYFAPTFPFASGIVWAVSTTATSFTAATNTDHDEEVNYA